MQLMSLEELGLVGTEIEVLPPEIGQLKTLTKLYLRDTPLKTLPYEMGQLSQLTILELNNSLLTFPPPEIQAQGTQAILAYLRDYQAMLVRQTIASIAAGIGGLAMLILAFRWRQRRGLGEKKKRL